MGLSWIPETYPFEMAHGFLWSPCICDVGMSLWETIAVMVNFSA